MKRDNPIPKKPLVGEFDERELLAAVEDMAERARTGNFSGLMISTWDERTKSFIRRRLP